MPALPQPVADHHDIFLSHSGSQKGFASDLYRVLTSHGLSTFLDITHHSLPLAEPFPIRIFEAASTCKLAVVVLSNEYLSSKWPMSELCAFVRAAPFVKILPLFLHLLPEDLKNDQNLQRWRMQWNSFAELEPQRINVKEWEKALKPLRSHNGLVHNPRSEGQLAFIERIVCSILSSPGLTPRNRYDTDYVQGEARLCEIIVDKLEDMETRWRQHECRTDPSSSTSAESNGIACILGLHGISGSGKSTLCRSLENYFLRLYAGKSVQVELPTDPTPLTLLHALRGLLRLTTLHIETDQVTHIDQLVSVIKSHGLSRNTIFLAVDNICGESTKAVSRILPHVIGPGSKVILTACTHEVLQPILRILMSSLAENCTCDCISMPSINEDEAMDILLQTMGRGVAWGPDEGAHLPREPQLHLVTQKQKVLQVVRMCGFGDSKDGPLMYLPVVMERMGAALITHQNDIDEWARDQERFWSSFNDQDVRVSREHVVIELVLKSFMTSLGDQLQLLFMDVALFSQRVQDIRPFYESYTSRLEEAYSILSSMHGKDVVEIRKMVRDLQRLCFVQKVSSKGLLVHDVYKEFASSFYKKRFIHGVYGIFSYSGKRTLFLDEKMINQDKAGRPLRAMILDVGWKCEKLILQNFPELKALIVRNCKSLATFRMAGLTSLATLDVRGFGSKFPWLKCRDAPLRDVQRLNLGCLVLHMQDAANCRKNVFFRGYITDGMGLSKCISTVLKRQPVVGIAMHMRGLRSLMLRGTGIEKLEDIGSCWPHLQELQVHECLLTKFSLGALPALTSFVFKDCIHREHHLILYNEPQPELRISHTEKLSYYYWQEFKRSQLDRKKRKVFVLEGEGFLMGCPSLQEVRITSAFFYNAHLMNPSCTGLRVLELVCVHTKELPDLSSCVHTLEILTLASCNNLRQVDLSAGFESLTELTLTQCDSLVLVKLTSLPSLRRLVVTGMCELRVLNGLDDVLVQLEFLEMAALYSMNSEGLVSSVEGLQYDRQLGGRLQTLSLCDFREDPSAKRVFSTELQHLSYLWDFWEIPSWKCWESSPPMFGGFSSADSPDLRFRPGLFNFIETFSVKFLSDLTTLRLQYLRHLNLVYGIESLIHLTCLSLRGCKSLEELPSLHALQQMKMLLLADCVKLRTVRGIDLMGELRIAEFHGCESLEELPFKDVHLIERNHPQLVRLSFEECKFACTRELMVAWAQVECRVVRHAVLEQFLWEYYNVHGTRGNDKKRQLVGEALLPCLLSHVPLDQHNCIDFKQWEDIVEHHASYDYKWSSYVDEEKLVRLMQQDDKIVSGKPKDVLLQQSTTLTLLFCDVLDASMHEHLKLPHTT